MPHSPIESILPSVPRRDNPSPTRPVSPDTTPLYPESLPDISESSEVDRSRIKNRFYDLYLLASKSNPLQAEEIFRDLMQALQPVLVNRPTISQSSGTSYDNEYGETSSGFSESDREDLDRRDAIEIRQMNEASEQEKIISEVFKNLEYLLEETLEIKQLYRYSNEQMYVDQKIKNCLRLLEDTKNNLEKISSTDVTYLLVDLERLSSLFLNPMEYDNLYDRVYNFRDIADRVFSKYPDYEQMDIDDMNARDNSQEPQN